MTLEERERLEMLMGEKNALLPSIHIPNANQKVAVKMNAINFEGVFMQNRMMEMKK